LAFCCLKKHRSFFPETDDVAFKNRLDKTPGIRNFCFTATAAAATTLVMDLLAFHHTSKVKRLIKMNRYYPLFFSPFY